MLVCMLSCMLLQETGDGELVVLHDLHSVLAASQHYEVNHNIMAELARAGLQPDAPATTTMASTLHTHMPCWLWLLQMQQLLCKTLHLWHSTCMSQRQPLSTGVATASEHAASTSLCPSALLVQSISTVKMRCTMYITCRCLPQHVVMHGTSHLAVARSCSMDKIKMQHSARRHILIARYPTAPAQPDKLAPDAKSKP